MHASVFRSTHAEVCVLNAIGQAVPKLAHTQQGGFSPGNVKKAHPPTCRFTPEHIHAKHASICATLHTQYGYEIAYVSTQWWKKTQKALSEAWFPRSVLSSVCHSSCKPLPGAFAHTLVPPASPRLGLCPVPRAAPELTELSASVKHPRVGQLVRREQELRKPEQEKQCPLCIMRLDSCQIPLHPLPLLNTSIISWQSKP